MKYSLPWKLFSLPEYQPKLLPGASQSASLGKSRDKTGLVPSGSFLCRNESACSEPVCTNSRSLLAILVRWLAGFNVTVKMRS